jgi:hypothetical protein
LEKKILICIGTDQAKNVRARLSLLVLEGEKVLSEQFHSVTLQPGHDLEAVRALVEEHIGREGGGVPLAPWPKIPDAEWRRVERVCQIFHT